MKSVLLRFITPVLLCTLTVPAARAIPFGFSTTESSQYLIIATQRVGPSQDNKGQEVDVNNFELGANKAPVPADGDPTLLGAVPTLPANAAPVFSGVGGHGNIAITDSRGVINLQDVGVYADRSVGIRLAAPMAGNNGSEYNTSQNSFFNDPNQFPNTYDPVTGARVIVNPNDAVQSTRIDASGSPGNAGVTFGYNHSPLLSELNSARSSINALTATAVLNTSASGGTLTGESGKASSLSGGGATISFAPGLNSKGGYDVTINLQSGLNVIDIVTSGNDFKLDNANLVINGPADAVVIFRLPDSREWGANMQVSQSNILIGNGGISDHSVMFFTDQNQNDTHFSFNNTIINGIAFWSLGENGGVINVNDAQGCTQLIADIVSLDDVRFNRCAFGEQVPDGGTTLGMLGIALLGLGWAGHKTKRFKTQS